MTGIRRRISIAFLSIVGLLFASGMISFFELSHLSYDTEEILKANQRNVELAKEMLGAVHDQNVAIVHLAILQDASYDSLCRTGMQRLEHAVATAQKGTEFKAMLNHMGFDVMLQVSGSTSTLLGAFFLGMSDHASGTELDAAGVKAMFAGGLANVQKQTKAQKGDKTMMDALIPAVEAIQACPSDDIKEILEAGAKAALAGAASTVEMKANFGRARNYGERSVGYADSGATSWSCMFESFAQAL